MIHFRDLSLRGSDRTAALRRLGCVLDSGRFLFGRETHLFEKEFAAYIGARYCVTVASGTDAITLSLLALGLKPGDEVLVPAFTAMATLVGVERAGAVPVAVDVDPRNGLIDLRKAEQRVTKKTRAIVAVHLYGQPCDLAEARALAARKKLFLVEDCAQSAGARFAGKRTGAWGHCAAFSFYPTKNLAAIGDAGAVVTSDRNAYQRLLRLRQCGVDGKSPMSRGLNSRMDELQAAILRHRLKSLDQNNARRRAMAARYRSVFPEAACLLEPRRGEAVFHQFVIKVKRRFRVQNLLRRSGIETLIHYPYVAGAQRRTGARRRFPAAEELAATVLSLPFHPSLSRSAEKRIIRAVSRLLGR